MPQRRMVLLAQLSALLVAGLLSGMALAGCGSGGAAITTGRADRSAALSTVERTVTSTQPTTVRETQTEQQTVTTGPTIISPTVTTTGESTSSSETPAWVWALVAVLGLGVVALVIVLLVRRRGPGEVPLEQRRQLVAAAVSSWVAQGWAIESQTDDSAILQREGQHIVLSVDSRGRVTSGPLGPPQQ